MNKKLLIWLVFVGIILVSIIIDYKEYNINESDLDISIYNVLSNITYPEDVDYVIEDQYEKGRVRFYSGQVFNEENKGPFIVGVRKHWLLPRYDNCEWILRLTSTYITEHGKEIETLYFKYTAYQVDESHELTVEREINKVTVFQFCITTGAVLLGIYLGNNMKKNSLIK
ncbi:MAG: hypothetical protein ACI8WT_002185 [Clostridium sp.]|jgi:hypothetical protein